MYRHGPSCLRGPVTRTPDLWTPGDGELPYTQPHAAGTPDISPPSKDSPPGDPPIRAELVERIRREIAEGTYETPEKWEAALDRLLEHCEEDESL